MIYLGKLRPTGSGWEFESEAALEYFLWDNLEALFGVQPFKRQYYVREQFCDIIAIGENKQLVVLELKNTEDRYVVQQLTRYYDALLEEQAFSDIVDYAQPVRLVAISPSFHRDNFTDRKYHTLDIEFWTFSVIEENEKFYFYLNKINTNEKLKFPIHQIDLQEPGGIPSPPRKLETMLSQCSSWQQAEIVKIREKLLTFDVRMQEFSSQGSIKYGNNQGKNNKLCGEFCTDSQSNIILFLWLPYKGGKSERVGRARIWTNWQGHALIEGYVSKGIGAKITWHKKGMASFKERYIEKSKKSVLWPTAKEWNRYLKAFNKIKKQIQERQPITLEDIELIEYLQQKKYPLTGAPYQLLTDLVDLSLDKWLERL